MNKAAYKTAYKCFNLGTDFDYFVKFSLLHGDSVFHSQHLDRFSVDETRERSCNSIVTEPSFGSQLTPRKPSIATECLDDRDIGFTISLFLSNLQITFWTIQLWFDHS